MAPNSDEGTVRFTVELDGNMYGQAVFREMIEEHGGEIVSEEVVEESD